MTQAVYHVLNIAGIWYARAEGQRAALFSGPSKKEVLGKLRALAKTNPPYSIVIHNPNGTTESESFR